MTSLRELPKRVDGLALQVSQLRSEMPAEFSAIRGEMATRSDLASGLSAVRAEMAAEFVTVRAEIGDLGRQMRVLHEDLVGRIALLQEGFPPPGRRTKRR